MGGLKAVVETFLSLFSGLESHRLLLNPIESDETSWQV